MILDPDTACALVFKIRRLHGKELAGPDVLASNDADDGMDDVLVEGRDGGNIADINGLIEGLESEQLDELTGLFLYGRDPDSYENLNQAKSAAADLSTALIDLIQEDPAAAEYLAAGLEEAGITCDGLDGAAPKPAEGSVRRVTRRV